MLGSLGPLFVFRDFGTKGDASPDDAMWDKVLLRIDSKIRARIGFANVSGEGAAGRWIAVVREVEEVVPSTVGTKHGVVAKGGDVYRCTYVIV